ncbi:MAG: hypothetical protein K2W82_09755 [Candidatus Obscuribacterales bacterium]|nr:hypothetical protein [Candidatus Obscuribacterales bacterium]
MNYFKTLSLLAMTVALAAPAYSETETTVIETRTVTTPSVVSTPVTVTTPLAASVRTYAVVDPISGVVKDYYDPQVRRTISGVVLSPGLIVVDRGNGRLIGSIDALGNIVDLKMATAAPLLTTSIDTRRRDLEMALDSALSKGEITVAQAQELRDGLEKIAAQEAAALAAGSAINTYEAMLLATNLDMLQARFAPIVKTVTVKPVISPQFITVSGQTVYTDTLTYRRTKILQRIDDEYAAGRLSSENVSDLKSKLNSIASDETRYRKDGDLSSSRRKTLDVKLDRVQTALERDVANINAKRSRIGIRVD